MFGGMTGRSALPTREVGPRPRSNAGLVPAGQRIHAWGTATPPWFGCAPPQRERTVIRSRQSGHPSVAAVGQHERRLVAMDQIEVHPVLPADSAATADVWPAMRSV